MNRISNNEFQEIIETKKINKGKFTNQKVVEYKRIVEQKIKKEYKDKLLLQLELHEIHIRDNWQAIPIEQLIPNTIKFFRQIVNDL